MPPEAALATADYLSLSVTVPRLEGHPDPSVQGTINTRLKEHVDRAEAAFVTAIAEVQEVIVADGGSLDELPPSQYVLDYTVGLITDQALSIRFDEFSYTIGAANPANAITAINVDLATGMPLELTDVFTGEEFAFALDELARQQLIATLWQGDEAGFAEWVGDAAVIADFEHWSLSPAGLVMAWDEFAVGPGVLGAPSVLIPWSSIGVYVDGDGPAGPFVSG